MTIRNYEYGLLPPTTNADLVDEQLRHGHHYHNALIEIERERMAAVTALLAAHPDTEPLVAHATALRGQYEQAQLVIKSARQATRDRSETMAMRAEAKRLSGEWKAARLAVGEAKRSIYTDPTIVEGLARIEEHAAIRVRTARAATCAYWSTYLLAEQAMDGFRATKPPPGKPKLPPFFRRWTGEGRIAVQLQGGLDLAEVWGGDTQLVIEPVAWDADAARGDRRRASRTTLRMRVQSTDKGKPIWAEWPLILHRPIPPGSRIKVATVSKRRLDCRRWSWRLLLTIEIPDGLESQRVVPIGGAVALNLGWAATPGDAVRAGYLVGSDELTREVIVSRAVIDRVQKAEAIQSQRDRNLDVARSALVTWLRAHEPTLPSWLAERAILDRGPEPRRRSWHIGVWRSPARFFEFARVWRAQRFEGDSEGYELLEAWRYRDEHLQRYEAGMARGALLDRRETYRILAAEMARRYQFLIVDNFDLRTFAAEPEPEAATDKPARRRNQRHAAGSELRAALTNAFGAARTIRDRAADVTRPCSECQVINLWDAAKGREHTCSGCGTTWDQDANACQNLLRRWRERGAVDGGSETARVDSAVIRKESRTTRMLRGKRERKEAAAARE